MSALLPKGSICRLKLTSRSLSAKMAVGNQQRQFSFLRIIHDLEKPGHAQFLISAHSPIILSSPGAILFSLDGEKIQKTAYRETDHYIVTRNFLNSPERFFKHLFDTRDENVE
jgi:predicted ATPase